MKAKKSLQVAEVVPNKNESLIVRAIHLRVYVLVKCKQLTLLTQVRQDLC